MADSTTGISSTLGSTAAAAATTASGGTASMNSTDFLKIMLTQLQKQDPLNPSSSTDLLTQLSQIQSMQANTTLSSTLNSLSLQQSIGAGGNLIGKSVSGIASDGTSVSGNVTSVTVQNQTVSLQLDSGKSLPLTSVTNITNATAANPATTAATNPLASLASMIPGLSGLVPGATPTPTPTPTSTATNPLTSLTSLLH
jgi:flagellar basal-body rod modification protein FlgD